MLDRYSKYSHPSNCSLTNYLPYTSSNSDNSHPNPHPNPTPDLHHLSNSIPHHLIYIPHLLFNPVLVILTIPLHRPSSWAHPITPSRSLSLDSILLTLIIQGSMIHVFHLKPFIPHSRHQELNPHLQGHPILFLPTWSLNPHSPTTTFQLWRIRISWR